ncbi:MAG: methyltransferase domain-containing protein [Gammaproteobacteria bacterium]|nr:methyltransferase domain-containing protein [Gammaproteobacteria bacterium]
MSSINRGRAKRCGDNKQDTPDSKAYETLRMRVEETIKQHAGEGIDAPHKLFKNPRWDVQLLRETYDFGNKKVLDVGCSYGTSLLFWGDDSEGVEVDRNSVRFLEKMGRTVHVLNIEDGLWSSVPERAYSGAFSSNLIEHLVAPHMFLANLYRVLDDGGILALQHPVVVPVAVNRFSRIFPPMRVLIGRQGWHAGEHINFFTPRTIRLTLERAGFVVMEQFGGYFRRFPTLGRRIVPISSKCLSICRKDDRYRYARKRRPEFDPAWTRELLALYRR